MKFLILLSLCVTTFFNSNNNYVDDFETGFKYVVDNLQTFEHMNADEFAVAINRQFGAPEAYRVKSLTKVLQEGGNTWSKDMGQMLYALNTGINNAQTYEDFLRALTVFENSASGLGLSERQGALLYVRNLRDIMHLLYKSLQYYNQCCDIEEAIPQFWPRLGKCAAGVIGGTLSGSLGGAAIGAPVAGVGAVLGGIVGGIAGAYTAVATFCD